MKIALTSLKFKFLNAGFAPMYLFFGSGNVQYSLNILGNQWFGLVLYADGLHERRSSVQCAYTSAAISKTIQFKQALALDPANHKADIHDRPKASEKCQETIRRLSINTKFKNSVIFVIKNALVTRNFCLYRNKVIFHMYLGSVIRLWRSRGDSLV